jgi:hypothetical protein
MPDVTKETRVLRDPVTGELISVPAAEADDRAAREGLEFASLKEISSFNEREKYGSAGQTALGALELAGEAATLGLYAPEGAEAEARRRVLRRDSPVLAFGAETAAVLPGVAASALTGGAAGAVGLSARAAAAASILAEGGVSGFAQEQIQAREEGRDIDVGNILMYGVGGEIAGRLVPKALGAAARKAVGAGEDVLSGGADNVLVRAEQRAGQSGSDVAQAAPGPERDRFLRDNGRDIINRAADNTRKAMDSASERFTDLGDISKKRHKIAALVSKEHRGQDVWVSEQLDNFNQMRADLEGGPALDAHSIAGLSHEDLGADTFRPADLEWLRNDPGFKETGTPTPKKKGHAPPDPENGFYGTDSIVIKTEKPTPDGKPYLLDGSHRLQVAREQGKTHLPGRVVDGDGKIIYEGPIRIDGQAPKPGKSLGDVAGLGGIVKKLNSALDDIEQKMTSSRSAADRFIAADQAKRTLQKFHVFLGRSRMGAQDAAYHDQLMSVINGVQESLRTGLESEALWGRAGRFQADVNSAWHNRWFKGVMVAEGDLARMTGRDFDAKAITEFDPAKIRSFLEKDKVGRGLTEEKLNDVLDGYQEMAEAHRKWNMTDTKSLDRLQSDIADVRKAISEADEVQQAKPRADKADAAEAATDQLAMGVPVVGPAYVGIKRALRNINTAGKTHIRSSANTMVNGVRRVAKGLDAAAKVGAPVGAVAAGHLREREGTDARFKGTFPTMTQSFQAKREQIVTAMQEPDTLVDAIASSTGDLSEAMPEVHFRLSERMVVAMSYLSQNMPPGVELSLLGKHATPPDVQAIRQFARLWEAVMDPGAVVQDFSTMQATPAQARAIEAVHPDIFGQLQTDALNAVVDSPVRPPYERIRYLSQMFRIGDSLGGVWKASVAANIKNAMNVAPPNPEGLPSGTLQTSIESPRGIASIASGPSSGA